MFPRSSRHTILEMAHSVPMGGHMGRKKMTARSSADEVLLANHASRHCRFWQELCDLPEILSQPKGQSSHDASSSHRRTISPNSDGHRCLPSSKPVRKSLCIGVLRLCYQVPGSCPAEMQRGRGDC